MCFNPNDIERLAKQFKVLGEPTRLQILAAVCKQERSVQDICKCTGLGQANASKHLRLMKDAGIVACRKEGIWRYYRIILPEILDICFPSPEALKHGEISPALNQPKKETFGKK